MSRTGASGGFILARMSRTGAFGRMVLAKMCCIGGIRAHCVVNVCGFAFQSADVIVFSSVASFKAESNYQREKYSYHVRTLSYVSSYIA